MSVRPTHRRVVMLLENQPYPADVRVRREALSLTAAGYDVTVIAPRAAGQPRREWCDGVRVRRFRLPATPATRAGFFAEYLIANLQLQGRGAVELARGARILHLHNPPDTLWVVAALARALRRRVVYDQHDLVPELFRVKFGASRLASALVRMERATFAVADHVIVPNESHREVALTRGRVDPRRVTVVRNGPPEQTLARDAGTPREERLEAPHLVFLGSMESQDGVDLLPRLLHDLADRHGLTEARLTLIGDGSAREATARAFNGSGERVRFTGRVPFHRVPALLAQADICVDPAPANDLNHRSTMVKVAEYLAAAKPVVAFRLTETERTAGPAALYAPPGDAAAFAAQVARLATDGALRAELGRRGLARARDLTWERSETALLSAYAALDASP